MQALACLLTNGLTCLLSQAQGQVADTIYTNGKIYTVNEDEPWVEAVAIQAGKFIAVGSNADIEEVKGDQTKVVDLGGKFAMPGFTDAHLHPQIAFIHEESGRLLFDATSAEEVKEGLLAYAKENPGEGWIRAEKFRFGAFPDGKTNRQWIDAIIPSRPVYLVDESGHNAVANSKALELAGITKDTPDPEGGSIERDPDTGVPTGYLSETGMRAVASLLPPVHQGPHHTCNRAFFSGVPGAGNHFIYRYVCLSWIARCLPRN